MYYIIIYKNQSQKRIFTFDKAYIKRLMCRNDIECIYIDDNQTS